MRCLPIIAAAAALLAGCVAPPPPRGVAVGRPAYAPGPPAADPHCREERREAAAAQRFANRQAREAAVYGGRRQAYEADAARAEANRQRWQARRAC